MFLLDHIMAFVLLAQAEKGAGGGDAGGGGDGAAAPDPGWLGTLFSNPLMPLLIIGVMFYFLLILPERKKRKELENLLSSLKKNDPVTTAGGLCGWIVSAPQGSRTVTLRIGDDTKIKVLRSHITHVGPFEEVEEKDKKESS